MKRIKHTLLFGLLILVTLSGCAQQPGGATSFGQTVGDYETMIDVRLEGATDPATSEIFGKVVSTAPGVVSAKRYSSRLVPDEPQASWVMWRALVEEGTTTFLLQTEMMDMFREVIKEGGYLDLYGVPYRYSDSEIALLKGLRPMEATSRSLSFLVDRELARDREMSGY